MKIIQANIKPLDVGFMVSVLVYIETGSYKVYFNQYKNLDNKTLEHCKNYGYTMDYSEASKLFVGIDKDTFDSH